MRVAVVLVVASVCLAVGQAASLGEVKRHDAKKSKSLAMREILRELIDELNTAEEQSDESSMPKDTNHAPYFWHNAVSQHITTYTDVKPGQRINYVTAYDDDIWDKVTFSLMSNGQAEDYFDLKTVEKDAATGKHKDAKYPFTGEIYLKKPFKDYETTFNFVVEARDNGTIQKSDTINVVINVKKRLACLPGYTYDEGMRCLKLVTDPASFSDAQAYCQQELEGNEYAHIASGGHLAEPTNANQNQKIADLLKAMEKPVWIGAYFYPGSPNLWFWKTSGSIYWNNWMTGAPSTFNEDKRERCAAMVGTEESETAGQWVDQPCSAELPFVCEHFTFHGTGA